LSGFIRGNLSKDFFKKKTLKQNDFKIFFLKKNPQHQALGQQIITMACILRQGSKA